MNKPLLYDIKSIKTFYRFVKFINEYSSSNWSIISMSWKKDVKYPILRIPLHLRISRDNNENMSGWIRPPLVYRDKKKILHKVYKTNHNFCTCPDYKYRKKKYKGSCKHIVEYNINQIVFTYIKERTGEAGIAKNIKDFIGCWKPPKKGG